MEKSDIITRKWEKYFLKKINTWQAPANGDGQPVHSVTAADQIRPWCSRAVLAKLF